MDSGELAKVGAWLRTDCPGLLDDGHPCPAKGVLMGRRYRCSTCGTPLLPAAGVTVELGKIWLRVQKKRRG
jgi:hypothetical protein